jgi:hypothetical protein
MDAQIPKDPMSVGRGRGFWSRSITDAQYIERLRSKCKVNERGCWIWQGWFRKPPRDYGSMGYRGKAWTTHRLSYLLHKGPIPSNKVVCHTCDTPRCCNPQHLWLGTQRDNLVDSVIKKRHRCSGATHCSRGHAYDEENTYYAPPNGARVCKICHRGRQRMKSGWPEHLAYSVPAVAANEPTPTRVWAKRRAA